MEFQRVLLYAALAFTMLLMWQAWQADYGPQPQPATVAEQPRDGSVPEAPPAAGREATPQAPGRQSVERADRIVVETDLLRAEIDSLGGGIRKVDLLAFPVSSGSDQPITLMTDQGPELFFAESGLLAARSTPDAPAPTHHTRFRAAQTSYALTPGEDTLEVRLTWADQGVEVTKIYTFHRGDYVVDLTFEVRNGSGQPWHGHSYREFLRTPPTDSSFFIYTYTGGVLHSPEDPYQKYDFEDMADKPISKDVTGGWAAMIQHYFLGAWVPQQDATNHYYSRVQGGNRYILGMVGEEMVAAPGGTASQSAQLYVGPKLQERLAAVAPGLELTVDYGVLTLIADPLYWLLSTIHSLVGNWGWSIVLLTLLIKLAFYKLSATSYRSMAQMRKLQPRLQQLKERYGDDRQKVSEAMMKMYREEKVNPLSGCLPILVQIPVFIALYWVLLESVELRQAGWILWIDDLSVADPYFVLPLLMGATMLIQHKLNPTAAMDPIQAKVMLILPVVFTVFFAFFPAGLVLYWVANNTLSIAQQWYITKYVVKA